MSKLLILVLIAGSLVLTACQQGEVTSGGAESAYEEQQKKAEGLANKGETVYDNKP